MHERISVGAICFPGERARDVAAHLRALSPHRTSVVSPMLFAEGLPAVHDFVAGGPWTLEYLMHPFLAPRQLPETEAWGEARAQLDQVIAATEALGGRSIYMLTGGRGGLTWEQAAEAFCEAIAPCVARARDAGVALMIEPASTVFVDIHIAHSLRDAVQLAEMAGIGVCLDVFTCWTEAGLKQSIERAMPRCHLIQVSDYVLGDRASPCRAVPGDGAIPLARILGWALDAGYAGAFDLELLGPRIDAEGRVAACRRAAAWIGDFLEGRGV
ncbi:TIM barrel protein [Phenylobacterium sp. LjRoot225]|uniref:sugar phosphate isomerase/epimerase family protein n=1 Tax=Phenylobacterium sp. LjRoot225 TaxID=3342285 RepID=UPI003ED076DF